MDSKGNWTVSECIILVAAICIVGVMLVFVNNWTQANVCSYEFSGDVSGSMPVFYSQMDRTTSALINNFSGTFKGQMFCRDLWLALTVVGHRGI